MTIEAIGYSSDYQMQTNKKSSAASGFELAQLAIGSFGPAAMTATSGTSAEAITAAAVNASYGSASMAAGMSRSYTPSALSIGGSGLSSYGAYYSGGANLSTSTDMTTQVESMLSESAVSQAYLIGLQAEMGNQQVTVNAVSNTLNMKQMSELAVIRNLKTA